MDPTQARPVGEVLISLAQIVGSQVVIMFLIDRAAKIIEQTMARSSQEARVDLYGPKPILLSRIIGVASSAEAPITPQPAGSTGSNSPSAS